MPITNEQRGRDAEIRAQMLANEAGMRPSGFTFDVHGADSYVEVPLRRTSSDVGTFPFDAVPALIQVKGTTGSRQQVTLDVWKKLVCTPQPVFFLIFEYPDNESLEPVAAYLVHVDAALTERVLARCWEFEHAAGDDAVLRDHRLDLTWGSEHRLDEPKAASMRARMVAAIEDGMYSKRKLEWISRAGAGPRPLTITVGIRGAHDDVAPQLADFAVGLRTEVQIASMRGSVKRFGTARPDPRLAGGEGTLRWPHDRPPSLACSATVRHPATGDDAPLLGEMRCSHLVFRWLETQHFVVRFVQAHLDLTLRFGKGTVNLSFTIPPGATRLDALAAAGRAFELLLRGDCEIRFEVAGSPPHAEPIASVVDPLRFSPVLKDVLLGALYARTVARHVELPEDVLVDPDDLRDSLRLLRRAAMFVAPLAGKIDFSVTLESCAVGDEIAVLTPQWLALGDEIVVVHGAFIGATSKVSPDGPGVSVEVNDARPRLLVARRLSQPVARASADGWFDAARRKLSELSTARVAEPPGVEDEWPRYVERVFGPAVPPR